MGIVDWRTLRTLGVMYAGSRKADIDSAVPRETVHTMDRDTDQKFSAIAERDASSNNGWRNLCAYLTRNRKYHTCRRLPNLFGALQRPCNGKEETLEGNSMPPRCLSCSWSKLADEFLRIIRYTGIADLGNSKSSLRSGQHSPRHEVRTVSCWFH